jgi:tyrosyl-tRNA synthetase
VDRFFQLGQEYVERRGGYAAFARGIDRDRKGKSKDIEGRVEVLNNLEWTRDVGLLDFLRTVGKMARVNVMLARDRYVHIPVRCRLSTAEKSSVKNRLTSEQGISFTEFTYQLLQASDFLHLYRNYGCTIQLGGSDQWGNIVAGIDLIKRMAAAEQIDGEGSGMTAEEKVEESGMGVEGKREPAFGLTIPLLTTSSGEKFGKSAGNAVWLDHKRTSVSDFYQVSVRLSTGIGGSIQGEGKRRPVGQLRSSLRGVLC